MLLFEPTHSIYKENLFMNNYSKKQIYLNTYTNISHTNIYTNISLTQMGFVRAIPLKNAGWGKTPPLKKSRGGGVREKKIQGGGV